MSVLALNDPTWETVSEDSLFIEIVRPASIAGVSEERRKKNDKIGSAAQGSGAFQSIREINRPPLTGVLRSQFSSWQTEVYLALSGRALCLYGVDLGREKPHSCCVSERCLVYGQCSTVLYLAWEPKFPLVDH